MAISCQLILHDCHAPEAWLMLASVGGRFAGHRCDGWVSLLRHNPDVASGYAVGRCDASEH
eukprot:3946675-Prymnesium_polylepis.1